MVGHDEHDTHWVGDLTASSRPGSEMDLEPCLIHGHRRSAVFFTNCLDLCWGEVHAPLGSASGPLPETASKPMRSRGNECGRLETDATPEQSIGKNLKETVNKA